MSDNKQLFLTGYSEGGYVTMATHRALQSGVSSHRNELVSVVPGAGPYNVVLTLDKALARVRDENPLLGALLRPSFLKYLSDGNRATVRNALLKALLGSNAEVTFMPTVLDYYLEDDTSSIETQSNVFDWLPEVPVSLFHGRDDLTVSYLNSSSTLEAMKAKGAGDRVSLTDCMAKPAGHLECVQPYIQFMLGTFAKLAKDL